MRFLEEHGRYREAFKAAEAACLQFPDDAYLEEDLLRCYERDGWTDEALALRLRRFQRQPSVESYQAAVAAGAAAGRPAAPLRLTLFDVLQAAERRAVAESAAQLARLQSRGPRAYASPASRPAASAPLDVSLRASILCSESRWLEAWAVVQPPNGCHDAVLLSIARHLPATHHVEAVRVLKQVFVKVMRGASSPYREALALVTDIASRMPSEERAAWLQGLRVEFKAKRNFIGGLPAG